MQREFSNLPNKIFSLDLEEKDVKTIIEKIRKISRPLGGVEGVCILNKGIHTGNIRNKIIVDAKINENCKKGLTSRDNIDRYLLKWTGQWINYDKNIIDRDKGDYGSLRDENIFNCKEKILMKLFGLRPTAAYDNEQYYCNNSLVVIRLRDDKYNLKGILGVLNSKLVAFYYRNLFTSTHVRGGYIQFYKKDLETIPIRKLDNDNVKKIFDKIIQLVDKMLSLNKQLNSINVDFGHYVDLHPRVKDITLGKYLENMGLEESDKEVLNNANCIEGKVKEFEIAEEGEWLVFTLGYEKKNKQGKVSKAKIRAFRCRIKDEKMRKFLYYSMKEFVTPGKVGDGNLYERILKIKLPCFNLNWEKNVSTINDIMQKYLPNVEKWEKLKKEIEKTDKEIDQKVYELYGLTEEEIKIIEESVS